MQEIIIAVVTALLGGGIGAAVVGAINDRWRFKEQRKADKEDRAEAKADRTEKVEHTVETIQEEEEARNEKLEDRLQGFDLQLTALTEAMRLVLLDRVLYLGKKYVDDGEISFEDRRRFHAMHECYHTSLKGNGDADFIVNAVNELPLKH